MEPGNSGGPLLGSGGEVIGIVFAKSSTTADVGYAMATQQFAALAARSRGLSSTVQSGRCTKD